MATADQATKTARSPYEKLGGMVFLPRTIDLMRARIAGNAPTYKHNAGLSQILCDFFGLTADELQELVSANETDEAVLSALLARRPLSEAEIEEWNHRAVTRSPVNNPKAMATHLRKLAAAGASHRTDVVTMFDRIELEEGREVPLRG